jgi:hypothetical protein
MKLNNSIVRPFLTLIPVLCFSSAHGKQLQDVVIVAPDPVPVQIVGASSGQTEECALYDDSEYFQLDTIFSEPDFSYDTRLQVADNMDSFVVTRVVVRMTGETIDLGSIRLSFNTPGATINPGIVIDPPPSGNLGISFPPSSQIASGRLADAIFEPDTIFNFSTSMRVALINKDGGANVRALQAVVSVRGCLLHSPAP